MNMAAPRTWPAGYDVKRIEGAAEPLAGLGIVNESAESREGTMTSSRNETAWIELNDASSVASS